MVMAEPMRTFDLPIAHFPREDPGIVLTIGLNALQDLLTDVLLGSGTTQDTGTDAACLLVAVQDFWDTTVGDTQLPWDDTRSNTRRGQFHNLQANMIRQWAAVNKNTSKLVHPTLTCSTLHWSNSWKLTKIKWTCLTDMLVLYLTLERIASAEARTHHTDCSDCHFLKKKQIVALVCTVLDIPAFVVRRTSPVETSARASTGLLMIAKLRPAVEGNWIVGKRPTCSYEGIRWAVTTVAQSNGKSSSKKGGAPPRWAISSPSSPPLLSFFRQPAQRKVGSIPNEIN